MNKLTALSLLVSLLTLGISAFAGAGEGAKSGEALFKEYCTMCHPDGGNIIIPKKTLQKTDREANNIKTEADIVKTMRNPGPGMTRFDDKTIPDKEAQEIAKYILKTFNK